MKKAFKIGNKIKAIHDKYESGYTVTINGWKGIVTEDEDEDGNFYAIDEQNADPAYQLNSKHFELVTAAPIKSIYKPPKGMKNLAAAAKALKRTGPTKNYSVIVCGKLAINAHDDEEAKEEIQNLINNGLKIETMNNLQIDNPQLI